MITPPEESLIVEPTEMEFRKADLSLTPRLKLSNLETLIRRIDSPAASEYNFPLSAVRIDVCGSQT